MDYKKSSPFFIALLLLAVVLFSGCIWTENPDESLNSEGTLQPPMEEYPPQETPEEEIDQIPVEESLLEDGISLVLGVGETFSLQGETKLFEFEVVSIGQNAITLRYGADTRLISQGEFFDFGDVQVKVISIQYADSADDRSVELSIAGIQ
ncbi:MAG: hypothetical protein JW727_00020 [Candidatus Aenigmarchaeota archaeon]|nr:hypothetical protein [Candidatus Aenigmarchaeota archaeon]